MNRVVLRGIIQGIESSHMIGMVEYMKANLIVPNSHRGDSDTLIIKFRKFDCPYKDGDHVELVGNLRSYSEKQANGKNKVVIYVFTYFDTPEEDDSIVNFVQIDGRICKSDGVVNTTSGKQTIHTIIANNIITQETNQKVNSYIPTVGWGKTAVEMDTLNVSDFVEVTGELHSRTYKKEIDGEVEIRVAHELVVSDFRRGDQ